VKQLTLKQCIALVRICTVLAIAAIISLFLFSFTVADKYADEFLKQLGISKMEADSKITNTLLGGSIDAYGLKNIKTLAVSNRRTITKDLLVYVKKQAASPAFVKEYIAIRERNKPQLMETKTPEEFHKETIEQQKKAVADMEKIVANADASFKATYQKMLDDGRKQLKETEDPNNKVMKRYRQNYEANVKFTEEGNKRLLSEWESRYPANHQLYIKKRLEQFMVESADIDFNAELVEKNGKKYFVNKAYESKGHRWKMGFRAGKEVIEPARAFVQQWIAEIK
jgi:hypothetical protein